MNQTARIISIYAADTSGVCSALYEYGGMVIIHDASGCNSTYTTHDEPRWYDKKSMVFISGLTEKDAVMGNDDKFIEDIIISAAKLKPAFIALCASPLPAMIGTDLEAIAYAVESMTNIPSFSIKTNGMQSYLSGCDKAFLEIAKKMIKGKREGKKGKKDTPGKLRVNLLGVTPLDFPKKESVESLKGFINDSGFELNACVSVDTDLEELKKLPFGDVNLLLSSSSKLLADHLYDNYQIPYVKGVPYGIAYAKKIKEMLKKSADERIIINGCEDHRRSGDVAILGESIQSTSLACALLLDHGIKANVLETVGEGDLSVLKPFDLSCDDEKILEDELKKYTTIIGDPLFKPICEEKRFIDLPHEAFSGRCFTKNSPDLINREINILE